MTWEFRSHRLLAATASAVLLTAVSTAAQEKVKTPAPEANAAASMPEFVVEIPEITAESSTLDADAIRDILTGNVADYANDLASLDAARIVIPQATLSISGTDEDDQQIAFDVVYHDIELTDVVDGIAQGASIGGFSMTGMENVSAEIGAMTAADFDIGATLAFYGMTDAADDTGFKTIYRDLTFEGGTIDADGMTCTIGAAFTEEFRARPLEFSMMDFMELASEMEASGEDPSPELLSRFFAMYADMLTAFESTPTTFDGLDCSGVTEDDEPITFAMGKMTMGGFQPGRYPAISVDDLKVVVEGGEDAGNFSIANMVFKGFDFSAQADVLRSVPDNVDESWFEANFRSLIPAFEGFSVSGIDFDIPDPENSGERIAASVGSFDLTLANYVNGIPAAIDSSASNIVVTLPANSDEQIQQMIAAGITSVDLGFNLSLAWDEASETIAVRALTLEGADLASVTLAGTIGNAVAELFSTNTDLAAMAGMSMTVKDLKLDVTDAGLANILLTFAGAEQGVDANTMRPMMAGMAEGMVMGFLGGDEQAGKVSAALAAFIRGNQQLSLTVTALDEAGLTMFDFMAAEEDPSVLLSKVKIDATSE